MNVVTIHIGKLYQQAQQFSLPGRESTWVAKRLISLMSKGKLVGYSRAPSGEWVKTHVGEIPTKLRLRGVTPEVEEQISKEFWKLVSESPR